MVVAVVVITVVIVVIQSLSCIVPLVEIARFTPIFLQLFALHFFSWLDSGYGLYLNQSFMLPLPLNSSRSSVVILAFSYPLLQRMV